MEFGVQSVEVPAMSLNGTEFHVSLHCIEDAYVGSPVYSLLFALAIAVLVFWLGNSTLINPGSFQLLLPGAPSLGLPPGPRPWPLVGSVLSIGSEPFHQTLARWAGRYGPLMTVYLGNCPLVVISNAEMAKELLHDQDQSFAFRHYMTAGKYLGFNFRSIAFATYGDQWRDMRKLYNKTLLSPSSVRKSCGLREREIRTLMSNMYVCHKEGKPVNISKALRGWSATILLALIFGRNGFGQQNLSWLASIMKNFGHLSGRLILADYFPALRGLDIQGIFGKMKAVQEQMRQCTASLLDEYKFKAEGNPTNNEETCLADSLLKMLSAGVTDFDDVTMAIFDNIIGGTEPPAIAMDWTMAELLRHPDMIRRAQEEMDIVIGRSRVVTEADIPNLPFIQNIIKEALRLHPSAPLGISHSNMKPCELKGYHIPAKTSILVNLWAIGRDPNRWENPSEFYPDRFNDPRNSMINAFGKYHELIPFSAGRRGCPGMHLSMASMNLAVASLLHSFDWKPLGVLPSEIDTEEPRNTGFICQRLTDILCTVVPRLHYDLYQID